AGTKEWLNKAKDFIKEKGLGMLSAAANAALN
uniref:M-poneritoxin-Nc3b n=1 Tax=Neoponera commutata TaxID=613619 RepID=GTX3B_NEOCU|nr:RecName: Full=M-poneritoxin-Nc3b; Short=M-PONTX-Nc3b; AltName: Full=Poneratoxin; AltName: Full=Ponericin Nc3b [Pachycondyla commutata]